MACWGDNSFGQLGIGSTTDVGSGPGQMGSNLKTISLGTGGPLPAHSPPHPPPPGNHNPRRLPAPHFGALFVFTCSPAACFARATRAYRERERERE